MKKHAVITGDLVKSRKIKDTDIAPVINSLKETFGNINQQLLDGKASFEIYRGDSFQCLIPKPEMALLVAILIRAHLRTYEPSLSTASRNKIDKPILYAYSDARIAIGIGSISHNSIRIAESQGEAFEKSGHAFDALKKDNERLAISTFRETINRELEVECKLADAIISRWTATTADAIFHYLLFGYSQKQLAEKFEITQPGVHKRLAVYGNISSIQAFINRYKELISKAK